jgi:hypothetical protein
LLSGSPGWSDPDIMLDVVTSAKVVPLLDLIRLVFMSPDGAPTAQIHYEAVNAAFVCVKDPKQTLDDFIRSVETKCRVMTQRTGIVFAPNLIAVIILKGLDPSFDPQRREIERSAANVGGELPATVAAVREALTRLEGALPDEAASSAYFARKKDPPKKKVDDTGRKSGGSEQQERFIEKLKKENEELRRAASVAAGSGRGKVSGADTNEGKAVERDDKGAADKRKSNGNAAKGGGAQRSMPKGSGGSKTMRANAAYADYDSDYDESSSSDVDGNSVEVSRSDAAVLCLATVIGAMLVAWLSGACTYAALAFVGAVIGFSALATVLFNTIDTDLGTWALVAEMRSGALVLLDNGASDNLWGEESICKDFRPTTPARIKGASGTKTSFSSATNTLVDARGHFLQGAPNLLSYSWARTKYRIECIDGDGGEVPVFILTARDGTHALAFPEWKRVYPLLARYDAMGQVQWQHEAIAGQLGKSVTETIDRKVGHSLAKRASSLKHGEARHSAPKHGDIPGLVPKRPSRNVALDEPMSDEPPPSHDPEEERDAVTSDEVPPLLALNTLKEKHVRIRAKELTPARRNTAKAAAAEAKVLPSYSKKEVSQAVTAKQYSHALLTSSENLKRMLSGGHIVGTDVVGKDVDRGNEIWGDRLGATLTSTSNRGVARRGASAGRTVERGEKLEQIAFVDLLFVWGSIFLVSVFSPLGLPRVVKVNSKSEAELTRALSTLIDTIRAGGFTANEVHVDGEPGISAKGCVSTMAQKGVRIMSSTRGDHQFVVERENGILRTKMIQLALSVVWFLPPSWVDEAVLYCTDRQSFCLKSREEKDADTAGEKFFGRRLTAESLLFAFGDFVTSRVPTGISNTKDSVTRDECIFLRQVFDADDTAIVYSLRSKKIVRRRFTSLKLLPTPDHVVEIINNMYVEEMKVRDARPSAVTPNVVKMNDRMTDEDIARVEIMNHLSNVYKHEAVTLMSEGGYARQQAEDDEDPRDMPSLLTMPTRGGTPTPSKPGVRSQSDGDGSSSKPSGAPTAAAVPADAPPASPSHALAQGDNDHDGPPTSFVYDVERPERLTRLALAADCEVMSDDEDAELESEVEDDDANSASDSWIGRRLKEMRAFFTGVVTEVVVAFNMTVREASKAYPDQAFEASMKEMAQLLKHKAFKPVRKKTLTRSQVSKGIPCIWFAKLKYHPQTSALIKLKVRCCAAQSKRLQDPTKFIEPTSPTISKSGLMLALAWGTYLNYFMLSADVPGAYLWGKRHKSSEVVYGWLDRQMTMVAVAVDPSLQAFVVDGMLWGELGNLYGLVESGGAWYREILTTLMSEGFKSCELEPCLFTGYFRGHFLIIVLYVDDTICLGPTLRIGREFYKWLNTKYPGVFETVNDDGIITYLSCAIDCREKGCTLISQPDFVRKLVGDFGKVRLRTSPASLDLTVVDHDSPLLEGAAADRFRSFLMRVSWLAQMTRPDCLLAVTFLSQDLRNCTERSLKHLEHLIGYIAATTELGIRLEPDHDAPDEVEAYTDAAHAIMRLGFSCGGADVFWKNCPIYMGCRKSSVVPKASSESELLILSDFASQVIHVRNIAHAIGISQVLPSPIYTDSEAAIGAYKHGRPKALKTRHIGIREYWIKDRVDRKEIKLLFVPTEFQVADILTKPMCGAKFKQMRLWLMGWEPHPGPREAIRAAQLKKGGGSADDSDVADDEGE